MRSNKRTFGVGIAIGFILGLMLGLGLGFSFPLGVIGSHFVRLVNELAQEPAAETRSKLWLALPQTPTPLTVPQLTARLPVPASEALRREVFNQTAHVTLLAVAVRTGEKPHRHDKSDMLVIMLKGKGNMTVSDQKFPMQAGDIVFVPKGVPHFFVNTDQEPSIALAVFTPPFQRGDIVPVKGSQ